MVNFHYNSQLDDDRYFTENSSKLIWPEIYSVTYMTEVTGKSKLVPHSNRYTRFT